ncbi:MAG: hypothetical protein ACRD63_05480 [Pyrinomonadaceae bacterium]
MDRKVFFQEAENLNDLTTEDVSKALVLLWVGSPSWKYKDLTAVIERLAREGALGITIAGKRADESFDALLETLGSMKLPKHVMTGVDKTDDVGDVVSGFLVAAIPDEARWDDWQEYRIIVIGDSNLWQQMLCSINEAVSELSS